MGRTIGLHLSANPYVGGEYQWWLSVIEALSKINQEGKHNVILFADEKKYSSIAQEFNLELIDYPEVGNKIQYAINKVFEMILPISLYKTLCCLWFPNMKKIRSRNIDIWFTKTLKGVKSGLGIICVAPIFDLMHLYIPEFPEVTENIDEREKMLKDLCVRADVLLADSVIGKEQIIESYGKYRNEIGEHIRVLPYIPAEYIYARKMAEDFDKPFEKYIFYPAQMWKHKNHLNLLRAINALKKEAIRINVVFVGSEKNAGNEVESYIEENDLSSQVKILGYVSNEEIVSLYCNARAMVYPSFFGPTNIPPLEAMQLGCPSAVSNIYAMPEQVGDAALLFDPRSVDEIKDCVKQLWEDDILCEELRKKGYARSKLYGKKEFKMKLEEIIESVNG